MNMEISLLQMLEGVGINLMDVNYSYVAAAVPLEAKGLEYVGINLMDVNYS